MAEKKNSIEISESIIFSVSEVTLHIRQVIETQIEALYIVGEISNFVRHSSGHLYFNLKDDNAVIRCAYFRNQNYGLNFQPQDGDQVVCFGKISVFEKSGQYQLLIQNMYPYGKGVLQQRFEQLKLKLKAEGLFDDEHKKTLPKYPETIGIITSPTGAALQDILNILERRYPCRVLVFPSLMQGDDSPAQVIRGLNYFNAENLVDLIIIARGGGSQEDLFGFNDESLARVIYASKLPVVSAIGHEIDFTIADFVADLRAPTPSAAAELVVPKVADVELLLDKTIQGIHTAMTYKLNKSQNNLHRSILRIMQYNPERVLQTFQQRFDDSVTKFTHLSDFITKLKENLNHKQLLFQSEMINISRNIIQSKRHKLEMSEMRLSYATKTRLKDLSHKLDIADTRLDELSPNVVLKRGFSFVRKQGKVIRSVQSIDVNDKLELVLSDGSAQVAVQSVEAGREV
jgi:exodeoxyribonuclease VII large subunit